MKRSEYEQAKQDIERIFSKTKNETIRFTDLCEKFPNHAHSHHDFKLIYNPDMTARQFIRAYYRKPPISNKKGDSSFWLDVVYPSQEGQDFHNMMMVGEMKYDDHCSGFIAAVRSGNGQIVNGYTLDALADFLEKHFCDAGGQWKFLKQGQKKRPLSSEDHARINAIIQDFLNYEGDYDSKMDSLTAKYRTCRTTIQAIVTESEKRARIEKASDAYNAGTITLDDFRKVIKKNIKDPPEMKWKGEYKDGA